MADYGVTDTGFVKMRLDTIRAAIVVDLTTRLGKPVETRPDSVLGELIDTFAEREAALWEMAEAVYGAMYPSTAVEDALDRAVEFAGVDRLEDASTIVYAVLYGQEGTVVPAGASVLASDTGTAFALASDTEITASAAADVTIAVTSVASSTTYVVTVGQASYAYASGTGASLTTIVAGLASALLPSGLAVSSDGASVRLQTTTEAPFSVAVSTGLTLSVLGSPASFAAEDVGPVSIMAGALIGTDASVPGWTSTANPTAGLPGRYAETDAELRVRYINGVYGLGAATVPALQANPLNRVAGATAAVVVENATSLPDVDGRPPHSVQVVVEGGADAAIAAELFRITAGGIDTFGTSSGIVTDAAGVPHTMRFSRPAPVYVWVRCVVDLLNEEAFPGSGLALVATAIASAGQVLGIGADVVLQRLYGPIYTACAGIAGLTITVAHSTDPAFVPGDADFTAGNITIAQTQRANFDLARISVT